MKERRQQVLRVFVLSVVLGFCSWLAIRVILLPVTNASDGSGHGPDQGSAEWHSVMTKKTQDREQLALYSGLAIGVLALPAQLWVFYRQNKSRNKDTSN